MVGIGCPAGAAKFTVRAHGWPLRCSKFADTCIDHGRMLAPSSRPVDSRIFYARVDLRVGIQRRQEHLQAGLGEVVARARRVLPVRKIDFRVE